MTSVITYDVIGEDVAALHVKEVGDRAIDARPAFNRIRDLVIRGNRLQFASKGAYFGDAWPPIAEATVARKGSAEALVATGALQASLTGGRGRKTSVTRSSLSVGTSVWYAHFAHGGTEHQPARQLVGVAERDMFAARSILERYIAEGLL